MVINIEIKEIIEESKVDIHKAVLYLMCIYHNIDSSMYLNITEAEITELNLLKIVERDYKTNTTKWNIPLYTGEATEFDWVRDWMKPFKEMNRDRAGVFATCLKRMKWFFSNYPQYRKEDVYLARDMYMRSVTSPQYVMKSHKFISDGAGVNKNSELLGYCEQLKENDTTSSVKGKLV